MKYIIVGAVAGGASTAARLRRMSEEAEIIMFERGAYVSYANCGLPYYIGNVIEDRNKLFVQTATGFRERFNIDVRIRTEVLSIDPNKKTIRAKNLDTGEAYEETYDKLVLSPGSEPIRPPFPGIDLPVIFTLRSVPDTDTIKSFTMSKSVKKAVVIGAGFIGLEMAENLHHLGIEVTIIEMAEQVMAPVDYPIAAIVQQHIRENNIKLRLKTAVQGFEKVENGVKILLDKGRHETADMVILSIGVRPESSLAEKAGLELGHKKGIKVNDFMQTSNPDIYAVGDAVEFANPITKQIMHTYLAGPANKQGRICANNIALGNKHTFSGAINTSIVKVMNYTVGATGVSAKSLKAQGIPFVTSTTRSASHAKYYPGAHMLTLQLTFSPNDGRILGAQAVGVDGVDKRLDVIAALIRMEGTIYDLTEFEQAYAPPFSSAKDPVNIAGFVAENCLNGVCKLIYWEDVMNKSEDVVLLDVRTDKEYTKKTIPGAIHIPLDDLRERLSEVPGNTTIYVFCAIGLRGYLAQRILLQKGYEEVYNLSGGFTLYDAIDMEKKALETFEMEVS